MRILFILFLLVNLTLPSFAQTNTHGPLLVMEEEDGDPSALAITVKVTNGTLTDNGDGTVSLATSSAVDGTIYGWSRSAPNVYLTNSTDNVGIGTSSPTDKLSVDGGVTATGTGTFNGLFTGTTGVYNVGSNEKKFKDAYFSGTLETNFIVPEFTAVVVSTGGTPDVSGTYGYNPAVVADYAGHRVYWRSDFAYYIWYYTPGDRWLISTTVGNTTNGWFGKNSPTQYLLGLYSGDVSHYTGTILVSAGSTPLTQGPTTFGLVKTAYFGTENSAASFYTATYGVEIGTDDYALDINGPFRTTEIDDYSGVLSIDSNNRYLYANDGSTVALDWSDGTLRDGNGNPIGGGSQTPWTGDIDTDGYDLICDDGTLFTDGTYASIDPYNRKLYDSSGNEMLDWSTNSAVTIAGSKSLDFTSGTSTGINMNGADISMTSGSEIIDGTYTSIDPNLRYLYASDGATYMLDWSNNAYVKVGGDLDMNNYDIKMATGSDITDGTYTSIDPYNRDLKASNGEEALEWATWGTVTLYNDSTSGTENKLEFHNNNDIGTLRFFNGTVSDGYFTIDRSIMPSTDGNIDLGSDNYAWDDLYANYLYIDHIGERTGSHGVVFDNNIVFGSSAAISDGGNLSIDPYQRQLLDQSGYAVFSWSTYSSPQLNGLTTDGFVKTTSTNGTLAVESFGVSDSYDDGSDTQISFTNGIATAISTPFNTNTVTNKVLIPSVLDKISSINPYTYKYAGKERFGFLADEIQAVMPTATFEDRHVNGEVGYRKDAIVAMLWKAVQELKANNDKLEARIKKLEEI